jgi:RNA polymerase sigma-70 factor, ECF subfamily
MTISQTQEQNLLQSLANNEQTAFRSIYDGFYRYLVVTAYAYLRDNDLARDTAQEVFVDLWRRRQDLPEINSLKAYLRRGVCNKSLDILRHRKRWQTDDTIPETISDSSRTEQLAETTELAEAVQKAIGELPEKCRAVFLLSRYEQLSHKEIAEQLDISTKTIENQMTKALRHLRMRLEEQGLMLWLILFLEKYRG